MDKTIYIGFVPREYYDDGTNIGWNDILNDGECFATQDDCEEWLVDNNYDLDEVKIERIEFTDDDEMCILPSYYKKPLTEITQPTTKTEDDKEEVYIVSVEWKVDGVTEWENNKVCKKLETAKKVLQSLRNEMLTEWAKNSDEGDFVFEDDTETHIMYQYNDYDQYYELKITSHEVID